MYKKEYDHLEMQCSVCHSNNWGGNQREIINNFNQGKMNLSDNSDCMSNKNKNYN